MIIFSLLFGDGIRRRTAGRHFSPSLHGSRYIEDDRPRSDCILNCLKAHGTRDTGLRDYLQPDHRYQPDGRLDGHLTEQVKRRLFAKDLDLAVWILKRADELGRKYEKREQRLSGN